MELLLNLLNELISKYNIEESDIAALQEAIGNLENGGAEEFGYDEPVEETEIEE